MAYANLTVTQLRDLLRDRGVRGYSNKNKAELIAMAERAGIQIPTTLATRPISPRITVPLVPPVARPVSPPRVTVPTPAPVTVIPKPIEEEVNRFIRNPQLLEDPTTRDTFIQTLNTLDNPELYNILVRMFGVYLDWPLTKQSLINKILGKIHEIPIPIVAERPPPTRVTVPAPWMFTEPIVEVINRFIRDPQLLEDPDYQNTLIRTLNTLDNPTLYNILVRTFSVYLDLPVTKDDLINRILGKIRELREIRATPILGVTERPPPPIVRVPPIAIPPVTKAPPMTAPPRPVLPPIVPLVTPGPVPTTTAQIIANLPKVPALARPATPIAKAPAQVATPKLPPVAPIIAPLIPVVTPVNIGDLEPPDDEIPDYVKLYIGDEITIKYHRVDAYLFWPLSEVTDETAEELNISVDVDDAQLIRDELLGDRKNILPPNTKILFIDTVLEYNLFDGTGYHFQDMNITIPNVVIRAHVRGFETYAEINGYFSYLYEFTKTNGQTGYLCILHSEGVGFGSNVSTRLAILI